MGKVYPRAFLRTHITAVAKTLSDLGTERLLEAAAELKTAQERGNTVFLCGNGGSAATASHFANDLIKMASMRAICLNDMTPTILAYMNDYGISNMFLGAFKVMTHKSIGENSHDVLVAISCSGNSENVLSVADCAKIEGRARVIAMTGDIGGKLADKADIVIRVPHPDIKVQEDVHLAVCHALAGVLTEKWD